MLARGIHAVIDIKALQLVYHRLRAQGRHGVEIQRDHVAPGDVAGLAAAAVQRPGHKSAHVLQIVLLGLGHTHVLVQRLHAPVGHPQPLVQFGHGERLPLPARFAPGIARADDDLAVMIHCITSPHIFAPPLSARDLRAPRERFFLRRRRWRGACGLTASTGDVGETRAIHFLDAYFRKADFPEISAAFNSISGGNPVKILPLHRVYSCTLMYTHVRPCTPMYNRQGRPRKPSPRRGRWHL